MPWQAIPPEEMMPTCAVGETWSVNEVTVLYSVINVIVRHFDIFFICIVKKFAFLAFEIVCC